MAKRSVNVAVLCCETIWPKRQNAELWEAALRGTSALKDVNLEFTLFHFASEEFPSVEELKRQNVVLVPGSTHSANEATPWIQRCKDTLKAVMTEPEVQHIKLIGCCFGCQIIAAALGGSVGRNPSKEVAFGVEHISAAKEWAAMPWASTAHVANDESKEAEGARPALPEFNVFVAHGECVTSVPKGMACMAASPSCAVEVYTDHSRVLAFQSHPEFTPAVMETVKAELQEEGALKADSAPKPKLRRCVKSARAVHFWRW